VELINARIGDDFPSELAFQSKIGPVKWLEPSTQNAILNMAKNGTKKIIVVPISFVSDHIETLQEIDIAYRRIALNAGLTEFIRAESPNLNPKFIESLTQILINRARM
jgi:ferrochelatase